MSKLGFQISFALFFLVSLAGAVEASTLDNPVPFISIACGIAMGCSASEFLRATRNL